MPYILITAPSEEPLTLEEAKAQCRVDADMNDDDSLIASLIVAAREQAESETGRALCAQTWKLVADAFDDVFELRPSPVQSVTSVNYLDSAGVEQTIDSSKYYLNRDAEPGRLMPAYGQQWPTTYPMESAVRVRYVCGYADAEAVPQSIKRWMLLAVATFYAQRETMISGQINALPDRFWERLLDPYRIYA